MENRISKFNKQDIYDLSLMFIGFVSVFTFFMV